MRKLKNKGRKGQAAVTDLFVALGIFVVLMIVTSVLWNLYTVRLSNRMIYDDLVMNTFQSFDVLLKTPGEPGNWEYLVSFDGKGVDDIVYVGLVEGERSVPCEKMNALETLGEDNIKKILHVGQYNLGIEVLDAGGERIKLIGTTGGGSKFSVNLARNIMYQNEECKDFQPAIIQLVLSR
tara:strand:- start:377 stop:916 length:540 start_codon:yes stop_codon:yes gene_type:complete